MNELEAYVFCCADSAKAAKLLGIAESTLARRLDRIGINSIWRERHRQAATIGRAAARLYVEAESKLDSAKVIEQSRKTIVRDYADLSANALRQLEANIRSAKSTRVLSRRRYELELHMARERL